MEFFGLRWKCGVNEMLFGDLGRFCDPFSIFFPASGVYMNIGAYRYPSACHGLRVFLEGWDGLYWGPPDGSYIRRY
jgi:hypothetical protein